jgi:hypothetical protein
MYMNAVTDGANAALRARPGQMPAPAVIDTPSAAPAANIPDVSAPTGIVVPPVATPDDPDAAPASAPPKPKTPEPQDAPAKGKDFEPNGDSAKPKEDVSETQQTNGDVKKEDGKSGTPSNGALA